MAPTGSGKATTQWVFMSVPAQTSLGPVSEVHAVFSNRDMASSSGGKLKVITMDYMLWESSGQFKRGLLMPGIEVLLGGLALGGSTVSPDEKSSLKRFCIFIHRLL